MRTKCNKKTPVYDKNGRLMPNRWIDKGDICQIGEKLGGFWAVTYPTRAGSNTAFVPSLDTLPEGCAILNQNDYGGIKYPARGYENATIKSGGCGVVAMTMVMQNLSLGLWNVANMAALALKSGARVSGGTDLNVLFKALSKDYGMTLEESYSHDALKSVVTDGGVAIINVGGDRGGYKGVFSNGGHYIVMLGVEGDRAAIADPGLYATKYTAAHRRVVTVKNGLCYAALDVIARDSQNRYPPYYIFRRK